MAACWGSGSPGSEVVSTDAVYRRFVVMQRG